MSHHEDPVIERDDESQRYVLADTPDEGYLKFEEDGDVVRLIHTEVADRREGQGIGSALVRAALQDVEERGSKVAPECEFVAGWLERHPDRAQQLAIV